MTLTQEALDLLFDDNDMDDLVAMIVAKFDAVDDLPVRTIAQHTLTEILENVQFISMMNTVDANHQLGQNIFTETQKIPRLSTRTAAGAAVCRKNLSRLDSTASRRRSSS